MTTPLSTDIYKSPLYQEPFDLSGLPLRPIDLLEHMLATGSTGSGKTRSFLMPLIEKILRRFGTNSTDKAGMFLMDAKGDMSQLAVECARRAGREEDVYILGEGGNCWYAVFDQFDGDATRIANFLFEILEDRTSKGSLARGGSNESFWEENARRLLRTAIIFAKSTHGDSMGGLTGIADAVDLILSIKRPPEFYSDDEEDEGKKQLGFCIFQAKEGYQKGCITTQEMSDFERYISQDVAGGNDKTWSTIANMTRNYLAQFSQPALRQLFEPDPTKTKITPEEIVDRGLLLIVSLSPAIYGEASAPFRMAVKKSFCERILQRVHLCIMEEDKPRVINQHRPVLYVCDEFHTTLSAGSGGEAFFLDRAREFRCMCVLATQGISAIQSVLGNAYLCDHLLNNCRTKFFFANDCPVTSNYFERLGGEEDRKVVSTTYQPRVAPARFRLPNHKYAEPQAMRMINRSTDTRRLPKFSAAELGKLPNGTALVVTKGRDLQKFTRDPAEYGANSPAWDADTVEPIGDISE